VGQYSDYVASLQGRMAPLSEANYFALYGVSPVANPTAFIQGSINTGQYAGQNVSFAGSGVSGFEVTTQKIQDATRLEAPASAAEYSPSPPPPPPATDIPALLEAHDQMIGGPVTTLVPAGPVMDAQLQRVNWGTIGGVAGGVLGGLIGGPGGAAVGSQLGGALGSAITGGGQGSSSGGTGMSIACGNGMVPSNGQCVPSQNPFGAGSALMGSCPPGYVRLGTACVKPTAALPGGQPFTVQSNAQGIAPQVGLYGVGFAPAQVGQINGHPLLRCGIRGTVLGRDNLCYNKRDLRRSDRKWTPAARPLLTGGELNILKRVDGLRKRLKGAAKHADLTCGKKGCSCKTTGSRRKK